MLSFDQVIKAIAGKDAVQYGVVGMRWGVRKDRSRGSSGPVPITTRSKPGEKVKVSGGEHRPAHEDAKRAAALGQKAKKSTTDSLSNEELSDLLKRLDLEHRYKKLNPPKKNPGVELAKKILLQQGEQELRKIMQGDLTRINQIEQLLGGGKPGKHRKR